VSRFSGPQGKGAGNATRKVRRVQAEERNAATRPEFRRAARLAAMADAAVAEFAEGDPGAAQARACEWPWKTAYENDGLARAALRRMPKARKTHVNPYPCPGGHVHLGRQLTRPMAGWRSK
jgi:hypothetical protein